MKLSRLTSFLLPLLVAACASHAPAPVIDRAPPPVSKPAVAPAATDSTTVIYTVKKGDTLYSIALDNGQDYKDIAVWNGLENPNLIKIGQQLRMTPPDEGAPVAVVRPVTSNVPVEVKPAQPETSNNDTLKREPVGGKMAYSEDALARARQGGSALAPAPAPATAPAESKTTEPKPSEKPTEPVVTKAPDDVDWMWPAGGKVLAPFNEGSSKGLDFAGKTGEPVLAAASGIVSYAGSGLRGYGNLVVLRHNATYLSVYAHNSKILVKEKQSVTKGQKIAEIGSTDAESPRLHFEIRRQGKPIDPQKLLPAR